MSFMQSCGEELSKSPLVSRAAPGRYKTHQNAINKYTTLYHNMGRGPNGLWDECSTTCRFPVRKQTGTEQNGTGTRPGRIPGRPWKEKWNAVLRAPPLH